MNRFVLGVLCGSVLAVAAVAAFGLRSTELPIAGAQVFTVRGAAETGVVEEAFAVRALNREVRKVAVQRAVVTVPQSYGQLTNITGGPEHTLWFVDSQGQIRNVILGPKLYLLQYDKGQ